MDIKPEKEREFQGTDIGSQGGVLPSFTFHPNELKKIDQSRN